MRVLMTSSAAASRLVLRSGCRTRRQRWLASPPAATFCSTSDYAPPHRPSEDGPASPPARSSAFNFAGDLGGPVAVGQAGVMTRTFTASDVEAFGALSGDFNPVHFDVVPASPFDAPIVHGMLYASMFGTTFATLVPGVIYLQQNLKFVSPVFVGDEVTSTIQVRKIKGNIAICDTTTHRVADGTQVIHGEAKVLIPEGML